MKILLKFAGLVWAALFVAVVVSFGVVAVSVDQFRLGGYELVFFLVLSFNGVLLAIVFRKILQWLFLTPFTRGEFNNLDDLRKGYLKGYLSPWLFAGVGGVMLTLVLLNIAPSNDMIIQVFSGGHVAMTILLLAMFPRRFSSLEREYRRRYPEIFDNDDS